MTSGTIITALMNVVSDNLQKGNITTKIVLVICHRHAPAPGGEQN